MAYKSVRSSFDDELEGIDDLLPSDEELRKETFYKKRSESAKWKNNTHGEKWKTSHSERMKKQNENKQWTENKSKANKSKAQTDEWIKANNNGRKKREENGWKEKNIEKNKLMYETEKWKQATLTPIVTPLGVFESIANAGREYAKVYNTAEKQEKVNISRLVSDETIKCFYSITLEEYRKIKDDQLFTLPSNDCGYREKQTKYTMVKGIVFESAVDAINYFSVLENIDKVKMKQTIHRRIRSDSYPEYKYITKEEYEEYKKNNP